MQELKSNPLPDLTKDRTGRKNPNVHYDPKKRRVLELKVWQLRVRRYTWAEIGQALGVPSSTAAWFYSQFEKRNDNDFKELDKSFIAREMVDMAKQRLQTLNALYRDAKNENIKLGCINSMRAETEHILQTLQTLGEVDKEPDKLSIIELEQTIRMLAQHSNPNDVRAIASMLRQSTQNMN